MFCFQLNLMLFFPVFIVKETGPLLRGSICRHWPTAFGLLGNNTGYASACNVAFSCGGIVILNVTFKQCDFVQGALKGR